MSDRALFAAKLKSSGLTTADAKALGIELLSPSHKDLRAALPEHASVVPAMRLQYFDLDHKPRKGVYRLRLLGTLTSTRTGFGRGGELLRDGKPYRYLQPAKTPPAAYLPRAMSWREIAGDSKVPLLITEGELKAACACRHGYACVGLGGVWSWKSKDLGWRLLPELEEITWSRREVYLVFDSDAATNAQVAAALVALSRELRSRGAVVRIVNLPGNGASKVGLDDFIVANGKSAFDALLVTATADELAEKLYDFNSRYLLVTEPDVLYEEEHGSQFNPHKSAATTFADQVVLRRDGDKVREVPLLKEWLRWPQRRIARCFTYAPGKGHMVNDDQYNLWRGWGCEPREDDVRPWLAVLDHIFPAGHEESRAWFLKWLAFPIQHPGAKMATAVLLWSTETGVGKSLLGFVMKHVYGSNWRMLNQKEFEGGFTHWAERKQFVLVDDIASFSRREAKDNAAVMKTRITQSEIMINVKYVAHYTIPDTINYMLTSNYPDALYLDEKDRRYFVHKVPSAKLPMPVRERFSRWRDGDGAEDSGQGPGPGALFHYLMHEVQLGDFDRWTEPPMTESKAAMLQTSKSDVEVWCAKLARDPGSVLRFDKVAMRSDLYTNTELRALCERQTQMHSLTQQMLGIALQSEGFEKRVINVDGTSTGLWAVRNRAEWSAAQPKMWAKHYAKYGGAA